MFSLILLFCQIVGIAAVGITVWAMFVGQTQTLFSKKWTFVGHALEIHSVKKKEMSFKFSKV